MTVRAARFCDIPDIVGIMETTHKRSRDAERTTFDEIEAKQLLLRSIQRHGHQNYMGSLVLVSTSRHKVTGFIVGILDLIYPGIKELKVTDLLFIVSDGADPRDARNMVQEVIQWGRENPKVVKILLGCTDDVVDWTTVGKLYEATGLEQCGGLYRIEFDRTNELRKVEAG